MNVLFHSNTKAAVILFYLLPMQGPYKDQRSQRVIHSVEPPENTSAYQTCQLPPVRAALHQPEHRKHISVSLFVAFAMERLNGALQKL